MHIALAGATVTANAKLKMQSMLHAPAIRVQTYLAQDQHHKDSDEANADLQADTWLTLVMMCTWLMHVTAVHQRHCCCQF